MGLREKKECGVPKKITPFLQSSIFSAPVKGSKWCYYNIFTWSKHISHRLWNLLLPLGRNCGSGELGVSNGGSMCTQSLRCPESTRGVTAGHGLWCDWLPSGHEIRCPRLRLQETGLSKHQITQAYPHCPRARTQESRFNEVQMIKEENIYSWIQTVA